MTRELTYEVPVESWDHVIKVDPYTMVIHVHNGMKVQNLQRAE